MDTIKWVGECVCDTYTHTHSTTPWGPWVLHCLEYVLYLLSKLQGSSVKDDTSKLCYYVDASSDEDCSTNSEGSFTLSLRMDKPQQKQQQQHLSKQHNKSTLLPLATRSRKSLGYSPSPLNTHNHSPANLTASLKKR